MELMMARLGSKKKEKKKDGPPPSIGEAAWLRNLMMNFVGFFLGSLQVRCQGKAKRTGRRCRGSLACGLYGRAFQRRTPCVAADVRVASVSEIQGSAGCTSINQLMLGSARRAGLIFWGF